MSRVTVKDLRKELRYKDELIKTLRYRIGELEAMAMSRIYPGMVHQNTTFRADL